MSRKLLLGLTPVTVWRLNPPPTRVEPPGQTDVATTCVPGAYGPLVEAETTSVLRGTGAELLPGAGVVPGWVGPPDPAVAGRAPDAGCVPAVPPPLRPGIAGVPVVSFAAAPVGAEGVAPALGRPDACWAASGAFLAGVGDGPAIASTNPAFGRVSRRRKVASSRLRPSMLKLRAATVATWGWLNQSTVQASGPGMPVRIASIAEALLPTDCMSPR